MRVGSEQGSKQAPLWPGALERVFRAQVSVSNKSASDHAQSAISPDLAATDFQVGRGVAPGATRALEPHCPGLRPGGRATGWHDVSRAEGGGGGGRGRKAPAVLPSPPPPGVPMEDLWLEQQQAFGSASRGTSCAACPAPVSLSPRLAEAGGNERRRPVSRALPRGCGYCM